MGQRYSIERAKRVTTIRLHRPLELEVMLEVMDEVAAADDGLRRLWVLAPHSSFSRDELHAIAARGRQLWPGAGREAYLAADGLSFGLLRMLEVFGEQEDYETRVFRDAADAREWLGEWSPAAAAEEPAAAPRRRTEAPAAFVADGARRKIEAEVRSRYESELEFAGWFKRALLEFRIRREIAARVEPLDVLWADEDQRSP